MDIDIRNEQQNLKFNIKFMREEEGIYISKRNSK